MQYFGGHSYPARAGAARAESWAHKRVYRVQAQRVASAAQLAERTSQCMGAGAEFEKYQVMIREEDVLAALDEPRAIYSLQQRLDPSNKSTDALQELLMRMRTTGTVKFDIKTGKWRKA